MSIYTIGHSNLSIDAFMQKVADIHIIIDIRSHPTSKWPQFNHDYLEKYLPKHDKIYIWEPGLGGWHAHHADDSALVANMRKHDVDILPYCGKFPKQRISASRMVNPDKPNWSVVGLYDYSWFMTLPEFMAAAQRLIELGQGENVAIVCAEAVPWKCHRSMVADYLFYRHVNSNHIIANRILPHLNMIGNRLQRYDPRIISTWQAATAAPME
jgi:uncharacterized protein (DUF488 family)